MFKKIIPLIFITLLSPLAQAVSELNLIVGESNMVRLSGNAKTIFIANPEIADYQLPASKTLFLFAKKRGTTNLYVLDDRQRLLYSRRIIVKENVKDLQKKFRQTFPDENISVHFQGEQLVLNGVTNSPQKALAVVSLAEGYVSDPKKVINHINLDMPKQVHIRLRIAEIKRAESHRLGIRWGTLIETGANQSRLAFNLFALGALTDSVRTPNNNHASKDLTGLLEAMSKEGAAKLLAEPNLTALTGETASFHAGGEFPYIVPQGGLANTYSIQFRKYGVRLDMLPIILDRDRIRLTVKPEVSTLGNAVTVRGGVDSIPSVLVRKTESTIELASGETFALAGLIQSKDVTDVNKVPFLGDIPILGALFRSQEFKREETELVILVTAYTVKPKNINDFKTPLDNTRSPTAFELLLWGDPMGIKQEKYKPLGSNKQNSPNSKHSTPSRYIWGRPEFIY